MASTDFTKMTQTYGDLLFDLCFTLLGSQVPAQLAFSSIMRRARQELKTELASAPYKKYERPWILRLSTSKLRTFYLQSKVQFSKEEQFALEAPVHSGTRLTLLKAYMKRLSVDDQLLLTLRDKHQISMDELASALGSSVESLHLQRQQALRTLEDWIWGSQSAEPKGDRPYHTSPCFMWNQKFSEALDHKLETAFQKQLDTHLKDCKTCQTRLKHYHALISQIGLQSRQTLPASLKKSPFQMLFFPRGEVSRIAFSRWQAIPWPLRVAVQSVGIIFGVLFFVSVGPKLRTLYENRIEKSLGEFHEDQILVSNPGDLQEDLDDARLLSENASKGLNPDELSGEDDAEESDSRPAKNGVKSGKSELWRFTLKTVSPEELRPQVIQALTGIGISPSTHGISGTRVPGGIEFDFLLSQNKVGEVKAALEKLAPPPLPVAPENEPQEDDSKKGIRRAGNETFTWYRVKSRKEVPAGQAQIVIWLSQLN